MPALELSAGTIEYDDTGGSGPVVVLLHGLLMNGSLWGQVVADLRENYRCVSPTLPLGAHRRPMRRDADLSGPGLAGLIAELLDRLDLRDVTLVGCDWGGAQLLVAGGLDSRLGRLVLVAQEAFDNFPPGLPGRTIQLASRVPGGLAAALLPLRLRPLRRLPIAFGWLSKRPVQRDVMDSWLRPALRERAIRRDLNAYLDATTTDTYINAAEQLHRFDRPALVVWATEDRVMPRAHGRRLAGCFPDGRLVEIADSYTLIPQDQPTILAKAIHDFIRGSDRPDSSAEDPGHPGSSN